MSELTLQLVESAIASRNPASALDPIRDELFPRLEHARAIEDAEKAAHDTGTSPAWLGDALVADQVDGESRRDALARVLPRMLAIQDELERAIEATSGGDRGPQRARRAGDLAAVLGGLRSGAARSHRAAARYLVVA